MAPGAPVSLPFYSILSGSVRITTKSALELDQENPPLLGPRCFELLPSSLANPHRCGEATLYPLPMILETSIIREINSQRRMICLGASNSRSMISTDDTSATSSPPADMKAYSARSLRIGCSLTSSMLMSAPEGVAAKGCSRCCERQKRS